MIFFNSLNYTKQNKYIEKICIIFITASTIIMVFTPNEIYANLLMPYIWLSVMSIPIFSYVLFEGLRKNKAGSKITIIGTIAVIITVLIDTFGTINHDLYPLGKFFLLICFSVVVIKNLLQIMQHRSYLEEVIRIQKWR